MGKHKGSKGLSLTLKKYSKRAEFVFVVGFVFIVAMFSAANLLQNNEGGQMFPVGYVVIPGISGTHDGIDGRDITYVNFDEMVIAADQNVVLRLDTNAWEGEYLAYELDGKYIADVIVQRDLQAEQKEFVQFLLNLERGLHEISVYVPADGKVFVEKHVIIAI